MALYRGYDENGKKLSDYIVINLLDAIHKKQSKEELYPNEMKKKGIKLYLYKILKIGKIVIMQKTEKENIFDLPKEELFSRIYRISGITNKPDGRIKLVHSEISTAWTSREEIFDTNIAKYKRISNSGLYCLVEGIDFKISPAGEILKL